VFRPAFVNDLDEFLGDVHAPAVVPAVVEPLFEFLRGVVVEHVHVEFALLGEAGEGEVAGAEEGGDGVVGVGAKAEVELGVERMAEEELHHELARLELGGEAAQARLVFVGRCAQGELGAELFGELALEADDELVADSVLVGQEAVGGAEFVLGQALHADEQAALLPRATGPVFDERVDGFPATEVEVADTEVCALGDGEGFPQGGQEVESDVVEDAGHSYAVLSDSWGLERFVDGFRSVFWMVIGAEHRFR
jgi:hypothetical protein